MGFLSAFGAIASFFSKLFALLQQKQLVDLGKSEAVAEADNKGIEAIQRANTAAAKVTDSPKDVDDDPDNLDRLPRT